MTELPDDAPTWHKASYCEWDGHDILVYDEDGTLINIFRDYDLEDFATENHNKYCAKEGEK